MFDPTPILKWLAALPVAELVRTNAWAYPILETIHVVGLGLLFGGIVLFDLRLLGLHRGIDIDRLGQHVLPWVWLGFGLNAVSGALLFMSDAVSFAANGSFQVKMLLILLAGLNMVWFHARLYPSRAAWNQDMAPPLSVKITAVVSILIWLAVITAGRLIAYVA